ncbi:MAG: Uma2 family endonuclease, partial [Cyanobacteria bacterium P01_F01_bin.143]
KNELSGWLRREGFLDVIEPITNWVSPLLQIKFNLTEDHLKLFHPDGQRFLSYGEIYQRAEDAEKRANLLAEKLREMGIDPDQI